MRRVIGMDIHRTFAEVVFWKAGKLRPASAQLPSGGGSDRDAATAALECCGEGGDRRRELCARTVAVRHGLHRNQLYGWRRELRSAIVADAGVPVPDFVPVVAELRAAADAATMEIAVGGAVVRVGRGVDLAFLREIIGVLKAVSS